MMTHEQVHYRTIAAAEALGYAIGAPAFLSDPLRTQRDAVHAPTGDRFTATVEGLEVIESMQALTDLILQHNREAELCR